MARSTAPNYWRLDRKLGTLSSRLDVQLRKLRLYGADPRCVDDVLRAIELVDRAAERFTRNVEAGWRPAEGSRNAAQARTLCVGDEVTIAPDHVGRYARSAVLSRRGTRLYVLRLEPRGRVRLRLASPDCAGSVTAQIPRAHVVRRS